MHRHHRAIDTHSQRHRNNEQAEPIERDPVCIMITLGEVMVQLLVLLHRLDMANNAIVFPF